MAAFGAHADSIPEWWQRPLHRRVGAEAMAGGVVHTNSYVSGHNRESQAVDGAFGGGLRADFSFDATSRQGQLYPGVYQGIGVSASAYTPGNLLGTPVSVYVYQGAPFARFGHGLSLGYEWEFGAAMGWKHANAVQEGRPVSTAVTAHMGISLRLGWQLSPRWTLTAGVAGRHFSNGNTSIPNTGVNTLSAVVGVAYALGEPQQTATPDPALAEEADRGKWFFDVTAYGAGRKRIITTTDPHTLVPGTFGVAGVQGAAMRRLNRYFAAGVAIDLQYDENAALDDYIVDYTYDENIKFYRPPFGKQLRAGFSAHAELTMPIFALNVGLGIDALSPAGEKRFYQSLTLKTFVTRHIFINTGYRLGNFKDPQNLMLGLGYRF